MSQKLILPINRARLTASWKTQAYLARFGYVHYGADMVSAQGDRTLWASGAGTVLAAGNDSVVGKVIAIYYPNAQNHVDASVRDLILRYFHLDSVLVKPGDRVTKDTRLGLYGNTGSMSMACHLHLEADTDTKYPLYSPTVLRSGFLKGRALGATDASMTNPLSWLHCKTSAPDRQTYATANDAYIRAEDAQIATCT